jgi:superfamily II DNA/RNA helicase
MSFRKNNRFLIFCNSKKAVEKIASFIKVQLNMEALQYFAGLNSDQRTNVLYRFNNEDFNILVSTDLGSRGLDFSKPINTII